MRKESLKYLYLVVVFALLLLPATGVFAMANDPEPVEEPQQEDTLFTRYIAMGDSITHGFQGGAVDETRQPKAYGALLAEKMGTDFNLPLLKFPGFLVNIEDVGKGNIAWWKYFYPLVGGVRVNKSQDINNFGITGAEPKSYRTSAGNAGGFFKLVLGKDGDTALNQSLAKDPTFISFWLGNNDVLTAALTCNLDDLGPLSDFSNNFQYIVQRILEKDSVKGVVMANVPDVTSIPYLDDVDDPDYPEGSLKPFWLKEVAGSMALTPDDLAVIQAKGDLINLEIEETAYANGWAFVNANQIFFDIVYSGHELKDGNGDGTGRYVSSDYLGGIFSLDGVHPSTIGQAIVANYMIEAVNDSYGENLTGVDEYQVSENDSLYRDPYDPRHLINGWIGDAIVFVVELFM